jgi:hypothetical protein
MWKEERKHCRISLKAYESKRKESENLQREEKVLILKDLSERTWWKEEFLLFAEEINAWFGSVLKNDFLF